MYLTCLLFTIPCMTFLPAHWQISSAGVHLLQIISKLVKYCRFASRWVVTKNNRIKKSVHIHTHTDTQTYINIYIYHQMSKVGHHFLGFWKIKDKVVENLSVLKFDWAGTFFSYKKVFMCIFSKTNI